MKWKIRCSANKASFHTAYKVVCTDRATARHLSRSNHLMRNIKAGRNIFQSWNPNISKKRKVKFSLQQTMKAQRRGVEV
jgi:hypothetical protein